MSLSLLALSAWGQEPAAPAVAAPAPAAPAPAAPAPAAPAPAVAAPAVAAPAPLTQYRFQRPIVELSVHTEDRMTALVVWNTGTDVTPFYTLDVPFLLTWVVAPENAKSFMVVPLGTTELRKPEHWIPLTNQQGQYEENIYVSIHPITGQMPYIDGAYKDRESDSVRAFSRRPQTEVEGWTYLGNWSHAESTWKSVYWNQEDGADSLGRRRPIEGAPSSLVGQTLVADFPVRFRTGSSTQDPEVSPSNLIRPGAAVTVIELRYDITVLLNGVWAKVKLQ